jgi:hypothetical protein
LAEARPTSATTPVSRHQVEIIRKNVFFSLTFDHTHSITHVSPAGGNIVIHLELRGTAYIYIFLFFAGHILP